MASSAQRTSVFASLQLTNKAVAKLQQLEKDSTTGVQVRLSVPAFNVVKGVVVPAKFHDSQYNTPCFGVRIPSAIMALFDRRYQLGRELCDIAEEHGFRTPEYCLSDTIVSKQEKVLYLCKEAEKQGIDRKVVERIRKFVQEVQNTKEEGLTMDGWRKMIACHVGEGWEDHLHFDKVLQLFGMDEESSKKLRETPAPNGSTLEQFSVRWLAKAFTAYGPNGCLTDVLNLIFVMMDMQIKAPRELDIEKAVLDFKGFLSCGDISKLMELWLPTTIVMDCEMDDTLALVILLYLHKKLNQGAGDASQKLEVHAQLPEGDVVDCVEKHLQLVQTRCNDVTVHIFRDEESRNRHEVLRNFPETVLREFAARAMQAPVQAV
mmetsp:Transcript_23950/g.43978  ORF Transcript_23950/g.43978 Transcript_23950/m.43978 type:complete len:376 (+) Transcript_23950:70-1197(+)